MTTKNQTQAKKVTGQNEINYLTVGVASEEAGYLLTEDALTALVEASIVAETVPALQGQLTAANAATQTAKNALTVANETIATRDARITELEGQLEAAAAGDEFEEPVRPADKSGKKKKIAAHADPANPINAFADKLMGAPGIRKKPETTEEE